MADSFRYRKSSRITQGILLPILVLFLVLLYRTFVPVSQSEAGPLYMSVIFVLVTAYSYLILQVMREHTRIITIDPLGIRLQDLISDKSYKWHEITEYGMDDKGFGQFKSKNLYIRTSRTGRRKIRIADRAIENVNDMSSQIVNAAVNAKVIRTDNTSSIPFTKNYETTIWDGKI